MATDWVRPRGHDPFSLNFAKNLTPPEFWLAVGTSLRWAQLKVYARVIVSLPVSEAENERTFSIRKYGLGDRGGRTRNDLVTASVRVRMSQPQDRENPTGAGRLD